MFITATVLGEGRRKPDEERRFPSARWTPSEGRGKLSWGSGTVSCCLRRAQGRRKRLLGQCQRWGALSRARRVPAGSCRGSWPQPACQAPRTSRLWWLTRDFSPPPHSGEGALPFEPARLWEVSGTRGLPQPPDPRAQPRVRPPLSPVTEPEMERVNSQSAQTAWCGRRENKLTRVALGRARASPGLGRCGAEGAVGMGGCCSSERRAAAGTWPWHGSWERSSPTSCQWDTPAGWTAVRQRQPGVVGLWLKSFSPEHPKPSQRWPEQLLMPSCHAVPGGPHRVSCHTLICLLSAGPVPVSRCSSAFCSSSCRRQGCGFTPFPPAASLLLPETLPEFCFLFLPPHPKLSAGGMRPWPCSSSGCLGAVGAALVMCQPPDLGLCREAAAGMGIATGVLLRFKIGWGRHFWRCAAAVLRCP